MSFIQNTFSEPGKRRTLRKAEYPRMEAELYSWFVKQRSKHVVISSEILAEKAKHLYMKHYGNDKFIAKPELEDSEDCIPLSVLREESGQKETEDIATMLNNLVQSDDHVTELEVNELIDGNIDHLHADDDSLSEEEYEATDSQNLVKHEDALNSLNICLQWTEENITTINEIIALRRLKEEVTNRIFKKKCMQTKIMHFWK
ncbi:hypothetical protein QE152_g25704 [Popillia japonica]|uniref:HTH CENPB-type domain-containing protein n=1 Tax=Popillia japonica TaxID=7064 RepID=A0AAW1K0V6_POPJA